MIDFCAIARRLPKNQLLIHPALNTWISWQRHFTWQYSRVRSRSAAEGQIASICYMEVMLT